jgi:hypothetical protein
MNLWHARFGCAITGPQTGKRWLYAGIIELVKHLQDTRLLCHKLGESKAMLPLFPANFTANGRLR